MDSNIDTFYANLKKSLATKQRTQLFVELLETIDKELSSGLAEPNKVIDAFVPEGAFPEFRQLLIDILSNKGKTDLLTTIRSVHDTLSHEKYVDVTLAYSPNKLQQNELTDALRQVYGDNYMINFVEDVSILGGFTAIDTLGNYADYSLKKYIEEFIEKNYKTSPTKFEGTNE